MKDKMWAFLIHLGENCWYDRSDISDTCYGRWPESPKYRDFLNCDDDIWDSVVSRLPKFGVNTLLIDLADGVQYESHPELALRGSWSKQKLVSRLADARALGLEVLPKLNFSACHDAWLKEYSHMLSTKAYYAVVSDLIAEVCELFDSPRLFHLGMDEENHDNQREYSYETVRNGDLWWDDLYYFFERCEKAGTRPWVWSDYYWHFPEVFADKMPRDILQSNWDYGSHYQKNEDGTFGRGTSTKAYVELDRLGFEQVPTGSNWSCRYNMELAVEACRDSLDDQRLAGFMMAPWAFTIKSEYFTLLDGAQRLGIAKERYYPSDASAASKIGYVNRG